MKRKNRKYPSVEGDTKIKFALTVEGEWDWNEDLVKDFGGSPLVENLLTYHGDKKSFKIAFFHWLSDRIYSRTENMFENIKLASMDIPQGVSDVYTSIHEERLSDDKKEKLKALQEAEEKVAKLRNQLQGADNESG